MPRVTVTLTAEDLARGVPRKTRQCPVYLAADREVGAALKAVRVDGTLVVRSRRDPFGVTAGMDPGDQRRVREAVEAVDQGFPEAVTPFSFALHWE